MTVKIIYRSGYEDCEDYVYYEWDSLELYHDGVKVLDLCGDSRLGGPMVEQMSPGYVLKRALKALGIETKLEESHGE